MVDAVLEVPKPMGLLLLALILMRILWFRISPRPPKMGELKPWELRLSGIMQAALYVLMLAIPLSGILLSQSAGRSIDFFGIFALPEMLPVDPSVPAGQRSGVIAGAILHKNVFELTLYLLLVLHIAGFAKHHFIDGKKHFITRIWG